MGAQLGYKVRESALLCLWSYSKCSDLILWYVWYVKWGIVSKLLKSWFLWHPQISLPFFFHHPNIAIWSMCKVWLDLLWPNFSFLPFQCPLLFCGKLVWGGSDDWRRICGPIRMVQLSRYLPTTKFWNRPHYLPQVSSGRYMRKYSFTVSGRNFR